MAIVIDLPSDLYDCPKWWLNFVSHVLDSDPVALNIDLDFYLMPYHARFRDKNDDFQIIFENDMARIQFMLRWA